MKSIMLPPAASTLFYERLSILLIATIIAMRAGYAQGGIVVSIDLDVNTTSIENVRTFEVGEIVTARVILQTTGDTTLSSYGVSLRFDTSELNYGLGSRIDTLISGFSDGQVNTQIENTGLTDSTLNAIYGEINFADGIHLSSPAPSNVFNEISRFQFATVITNNDGFVDILPGKFKGALDGFFDGNNLLITDVIYNGATVNITAVPEPSSLILLMLAGLGAAARRHHALRLKVGEL